MRRRAISGEHPPEENEGPAPMELDAPEAS